jgi:hypothetical protein
VAGVRGEAERILPPEPGLVPSVARLCGNESRPSQGVMQPRNGCSVRVPRPKEAYVATIQGICSILLTGVLLTAPALAQTTGQANGDRIVLPGATQASLKGLPDFHYGSA